MWGSSSRRCTRRSPASDDAPSAARSRTDAGRAGRGPDRVGCVLPWWKVGGASGIPAVGGNGFEGAGIIVFLVGIAALALVAPPYAAGDRPLGIDRWLSYLLLTVVG